MAAMEHIFDSLIKEAETKAQQLNANILGGHAPTRSELEIYVWKTCRVVRQLIKPEANGVGDRAIFWSEIKGILKDCLVLEKFNPGVFDQDCVKKDILESNLKTMLENIAKYTKKRQSGKIKAPKEIQTMAHAEQRKRKQQEAEEAAKRKEDEEWWAKEDERWNNWNQNMAAGNRWDDEVSDPEEECPEIKKHGNCAWGRQCGFCFR